MKSIKLSLSGLMLSGVLFTTAFAAPPQEPDTPATAKIRATLHARYPKVNVGQIVPAPMPGLYELLTDAGLAYTDGNGDYLFLGKIIDTKTQEDLTEIRWSTLNGIEFDKLPFELALKYVKGDGKRKVAVFEDPHCPFCRQLEGELQKVTNATIYVFLFPIESLHPGATQTTRNIWCAKDRAATWIDTMLNNAKPPAANCKDDGLKSLLALGEKLNVDATPTLFFVDGHRHAGTMPSANLDKELNAAAANNEKK